MVRNACLAKPQESSDDIAKCILQDRKLEARATPCG